MTTQFDVQKTETTQPATAEPAANRVELTPAVDIYEQDDALVIVADMPGVDEKHLDVTLENDVLTLAGHAAAQDPAGLDPLYREFEAADFRRSFTIATDVDREKITATIRNGVLRITLPRAAAAKPQKIAVQGGA
ncbi:MAG: Hsp20/alpha crystallin family protein [bacterium]